MTLRYVVEENFAPAFTASKQVDLPSEAEALVNQQKKINARLKYSRFSGWILYDDNNKEVKRYPPSTQPLN